MSDEYNELFSAFDQQGQECDRIREQRDGLLAACQAAREWLGVPPAADDLRWPHYRAKLELMEKLEAAIKAAKGE